MNKIIKIKLEEIKKLILKNILGLELDENIQIKLEEKYLDCHIKDRIYFEKTDKTPGKRIDFLVRINREEFFECMRNITGENVTDVISVTNRLWTFVIEECVKKEKARRYEFTF